MQYGTQEEWLPKRANGWRFFANPVLLIIMTAFLAGGVSSFSKLSVQDIPPFSFTLLRFLIAGAFLMPFLGKGLKWSTYKGAFPISLLCTANILLFIVGIGSTNAGIGQMLYGAVPLLSLVFSRVLLGEKMEPRKVIGIMLGFAGIISIVLLPLLEKGTASGVDPWANVSIFCGATSFALYTVLCKKLQNTYAPSELTAAFILTSVLACLLLLPFDLVQTGAWWLRVPAQAWWGVVYVGILGTGFYYLAYQYAIRKATPTTAALTFYLQPIFAIVWAWMLLGEHGSWGFFAGSALVFIGLGFVLTSRMK